MMKAIFKPEKADVLIIRDSDANEASLISNFLRKIENGASVDFKAAYNGNQEINGLVLTVSEVPEKELDIPTHIKIVADVTNDEANYPLFRIEVRPENENFMSYKLDSDKWEILKTLFEGIGLVDASITPDGIITARNDSGSFITSNLVIPKGLFQYLNAEDSSVLNYNESLIIKLDNEPNFSEDAINSIPNDIWQTSFNPYIKPTNSSTTGSNNFINGSLDDFTCGCKDSINNPKSSRK